MLFYLFICYMFSTLSSISQCLCNSIKTFDFSTIPHRLLKSRINELVQRCFSKKNGEQRYQYLVIGRDWSYFVKSHSKSNNKHKQDEIIQILGFLIDNLVVLFGGRVFQQPIGIAMGTHCYPLLSDFFSTCRLPSRASQE